MTTRVPPAGAVSKRARWLMENHRLAEYVTAHMERVPDLWDAATNPNGYIPLCVAENKLVWDLLEPRFADCRDLVPEATGYDQMVGSRRFREKLAHFLGRTFLGDGVDPDRLAVVNGAGSALELLFWALCDPGDAVLVPTPSYMGFWLDLETRDEIEIVTVDTHREHDFELTPELLDEALASAGRPVKALLYTNPNNPIGRVDPPEKVEELLAWGESRGVHVVLDEIYALSIFDGSEFASGSRLRPEMSDWLHIVWAFSKDFGVSGFRSGLIYTHNEEVYETINHLAAWASTSGDTQSLLSQVIADDAWVDGFVAESRRRLRAAYDTATAILDRHDIPYVPGGAGFFFLVDVRSFLDEPTWEAEDRLWRSLLEREKVNITPGSACRNAEPGLMRLVFSGMPLEAVEVATERMAHHLSSIG